MAKVTIKRGRPRKSFEQKASSTQIKELNALKKQIKADFESRSKELKSSYESDYGSIYNQSQDVMLAKIEIIKKRIRAGSKPTKEQVKDVKLTSEFLNMSMVSLVQQEATRKFEDFREYLSRYSTIALGAIDKFYESIVPKDEYFYETLLKTMNYMPKFTLQGSPKREEKEKSSPTGDVYGDIFIDYFKRFYTNDSELMERYLASR